MLLNKGSLPYVHRSQYYGDSFWEKKELYLEVDQQRDRRQASQICLPIQG